MKLSLVAFAHHVPRPGTNDLVPLAKESDKDDLTFEQGIVTWKGERGVRMIPLANVLHMVPGAEKKK